MFFVFCLFCFLLLSINILHVTNILHATFYTYICYWNTFQYKDIKITFHDVKQSHAQVTLKYICLLFVIFACLFSVFPFAKSNLRENFFTLLQHSLTFLLFVFITKITWHLYKVNKNVNIDTKIESAIEPTFSFCVWGSRVSAFLLVNSLKRSINYCCWICTILCMIFKKPLFIEALCRLLSRKCAL